MQETLAAVAAADPTTTTDAPPTDGNSVETITPIIIPTDEIPQTTKDGVVYDGDDVDFVARNIQDGTQVLAVQHRPTVGQTTLSYQFPGAELQLLPDGHVAVVDATTEELDAVILPAWAKDANGTEVPTSYSVNGDTLTQTVTTTETHTFPVVSDPVVRTYWWGTSLDFSWNETLAIAGGAAACSTVLKAVPGIPSRVASLICLGVRAHAAAAVAQRKCISARWLITAGAVYPWIRSC